ncbi:MAG: DUF3336 domain-containing protein [Gammaproteobacteria bacterium]|nr:DUF3336 domain-containing protein [Gammaproteobacteria bacterium]
MTRSKNNHKRGMATASNYQEWFEAALAYDAHEGLNEWRREKESDDYDYRLIASRVTLIRKLRRQKDYDQLVFRLREELHGNLGNMANPALYNHAKAGTKKLIEDFINEVTAALDEICDADMKALPPMRKYRFFKRAARSFGRSALLLSGGASLGLFHVGVVLEMHKQQLLPRVITGSSVGSIVGSVIAAHSETELEELLWPDQVGFSWSRLMGVPDAIKGGSLMDQGLLRRSIDKNIPNLTFLEAYEKTGRILNISVSPADPHQFPRLLNYLTAPNVLVRRATLASCAFPGIFPPVQLRAKNYVGRSVGYMPQSRWIDGSVHEDIPKHKVNRLHNVNHYIVSQTNPHVVPFLGEEIEQTGLVPFIQDLLVKSPMIQIEHLLELVQRHFDLPGLGSVIKTAHAVVRQTYSGDITIYPESQVANWGKTFANLELNQVTELMQEGRRATWPNIERIRNTTKVSRTFDACLERLEKRYRVVRRKAPGAQSPR